MQKVPKHVIKYWQLSYNISIKKSLPECFWFRAQVYDILRLQTSRKPPQTTVKRVYISVSTAHNTLLKLQRETKWVQQQNSEAISMFNNLTHYDCLIYRKVLEAQQLPWITTTTGSTSHAGFIFLKKCTFLKMKPFNFFENESEKNSIQVRPQMTQA